MNLEAFLPSCAVRSLSDEGNLREALGWDYVEKMLREHLRNSSMLHWHFLPQADAYMQDRWCTTMLVLVSWKNIGSDCLCISGARQPCCVIWAHMGSFFCVRVDLKMYLKKKRGSARSSGQRLTAGVQLSACDLSAFAYLFQASQLHRLWGRAQHATAINGHYIVTHTDTYIRSRPGCSQIKSGCSALVLLMSSWSCLLSLLEEGGGV